MIVDKKMRLTTDIRNSLVAKAMEGYKQAEKTTLQQDLLTFGHDLYVHEFGEAGPVAFKLGPKWYSMAREIIVHCDGFGYRQGDHDEIYDHIDLGAELVFPAGYSDDNGVDRLTIDEHHPMYRRAQSLVKRHRAIYKAERELRAKIYAIVRPCTTVAKLEDAWPEGIRFLPEGARPFYAIVPVGLTQDVNRALGLAPDHAAQLLDRVK